jgi:hypothetical protein
MQYGWKGACAYLVVGLRLLALSMLRRFGVKAYGFDDGTAVRAYVLSCAFEPVVTERAETVQVGWRCPHASMTTGGLGGIEALSSTCGCRMAPVYDMARL